jgi:hypothetical protein
LLLLKRDEGVAEEEPTGALQIGVSWFGVYGPPGQWRLDADDQGLLMVWAGSAQMLAGAVRYVVNDPTADFPVRSELIWTSDWKLGSLGGPANGCLVVDLGPPHGRCVLALSDRGDRLFGRVREGEQVVDLTGSLRLGTASKRAAPADYDGDGRMDLACHDGARLLLALQGPDGAFSDRRPAIDLPNCRSLEAVDLGDPPRPGVLAGAPDGPLLLQPVGNGSLASRKLMAPRDSALREALGPGGVSVAADVNDDGRWDVLALYSRGMLLFGGQRAGRFQRPATIKIETVHNPRFAICGDYDADRRLDVMVAGDDGVALLRQSDGRSWENRTVITGELDYHGNANQPRIVGACPCDVNNDGRQSVALFHPQENPMLFFNRGFACFGLARELLLTGGAVLEDPLAGLDAPGGERLPAAEALQFGQSGGVVLDVNSDGAQDLVAADLQGEVWALLGEPRDGGSALALEIARAPHAAGPLTVRVSNNRRYLGAHVVKPGVPAFVGCAAKGPYLLQWKERDGQPRSRRVIVIRNTRVELAD